MMMRPRRLPTRSRIAAAALAALMVLSSTPLGWAASHREAPLIALDPTADITDVYAFRSWEDPSKAVFIMNVIPSQVPASGPNFFNFDDEVVYAFHLDLNADGNADDAVIEFRFTPSFDHRSTTFPSRMPALIPFPACHPPSRPSMGPDRRASASARSTPCGPVRSNGVTRVFSDESVATNGAPLIAVPSNVGARTMPNYPALAAKGIFGIAGNAIRVFAGQRKETFAIDLASAFDTLNFRRNPPVLTNPEDASDSTNPFGLNDFDGLNVNTIAVEVPIAALPPVVGMYASTSRSASQPLRLAQVARMGNPLVNELIIGTGSKDLWNATDPVDEAQFLGFYQIPRLAVLLNLAFGIPIPPTPRTDLVSALLQYPSGGILSELLRVDLTVPPTPAASQRRLGPLAHDAAGMATPDPAGWPNGRRPNDDVTDLAIRVVAGVLAGDACCSGFPHNRLGDGVNFSALPAGTPDVTANGIATKFPFLPTPLAGRR